MPPPLSQAMCDRARRLTAVHTQDTAAMILGIWPETIIKVRKRGWVAAEPGRKKRPRPTDFAIQVHHMQRRELARHYRAGNDTIARWARELRVMQ